MLCQVCWLALGFGLGFRHFHFANASALALLVNPAYANALERVLDGPAAGVNSSHH